MSHTDQGRIQTLFEVGNRFLANKNWYPNFARSTRDITLILFNSSQIDLNNEAQIYNVLTQSVFAIISLSL